MPPFPRPSSGFPGDSSCPCMGSRRNGDRWGGDAVTAAAVVIVKRPRRVTQRQRGQRPGEPARCAGRAAPLPGPHAPRWKMGQRCRDVCPLRGPECAQCERREAGPRPGRTGPRPSVLRARPGPSPAGLAPTSWVWGPEPPRLLTCLLQTGSPWEAGQSEGALCTSALPAPTQASGSVWLGSVTLASRVPSWGLSFLILKMGR